MPVYLVVLAVGLFIYSVMKAKPKFLFPVANPRITSKFGNRIHPITKVVSFHNGIDLAGVIGQAIAAPETGIVQSVFVNNAGGLQMTIKHPNSYTTGYAHLSRVLVEKNEQVKTGQKIAEIGNTGQSTGPHLHLTLKNNAGTYLDPEQYFI